MVKNSVVMVLDCGGGTVDITVHKLLCEPSEKLLCNELIPSSEVVNGAQNMLISILKNFLESS